MTNQTLSQLRDLKLPGMAQALQSQLEQVTTYEGLSFNDRLALMVDAETLSRVQRKQQRLNRQARFKLNATVEDIDYTHPRGLKKKVVASLASAQWISRRQNLLITGPCGSGKTYIGCALGHAACQRGDSVRYFKLSRLLLALTQARADASYAKLLKTIARTELLIIDDWGLEALTVTHRNDLMEIMDDRHDNASTMVLSQLPTDQWYSAIGDNTLADAILDRLMHNAHRLRLSGESMRKLRTNLTEDEHLS